jgi:hypothetical protein
MERPGLTIVAYHGCDRAVRDDLLSAGRSAISVKDSKNPYDWLGTGAYFLVSAFDSSAICAK